MVLVALAAISTFVLTGLAIPLLRHTHFIDVPNHRSSHATPTPRGGGVAVVVSLAVLALAMLEIDLALVSLVVAALLLGAVGLVDDVRSLPSAHRFGAQVVIAVGLTAALLSTGSVSWWWLAGLAVPLIGYVNAYNFMDGVNGISGLTAIVVGTWWAWVGSVIEDSMLMGAGLILAGAAIGFLPWNVPRARVFLGDVGSYGIGVFIGGLSTYAFAQGLAWHWALLPLVVYGADTGWVLVKRARAGRRLTEAHRDHVYQRLVDGGWSHLASALLCAGAAAAIAVAAAWAGASATGLVVLGGAVIVLAYLNTPRLVRSR